MAREKTVGGTIVKIVVGVVLTIVLVVVGLFLIAKYALGIDILGIYSSLKQLGTTVNTETIITYPYEKDNSMVNSLNNIFELKSGETGIVTGGDGSISVDYERLEGLLFDSDLELTDKQIACILDASLQKYINTSEENEKLFEGLELCQIKFIEYTEAGGKFDSITMNYVVRMSLDGIKSYMNSFPLTLFKGLLPSDLYVSSDIVIKKDNSGAWKYTTKAEETKINNLDNDKTNELVASISGILGVTDADELGVSIGEVIVNAIIGTPDNLGLGSGLLNAEDFTFRRANDTNYYVIKFNI